MKRKLLLLLALAMVLLAMTGCKETIYDSPEAMMSKIWERIDITDGATVDIRYIGQCERGDNALLWYASDTGEAGKEYHAMVCRLAKEGGYIFEQIHNTVERGENIVFYMWGEDYVFCIDNPACRTLRYTDHSGTHEVAIEEGAHPFLYKTAGQPVEYSFLDADGNEL